MATTYTDNGGGAPNGSKLEFTYTFPILQTEDIEVQLNGQVQATNKYTVDNTSNPTKITFNATNTDATFQNTTTGAPLSGVVVTVARVTNVSKGNADDNPKAVFASGSSIRASDLNANSEQALYAIHELQERKVITTRVSDGSITHIKLAADCVDGDNIQNDVINSEHYVDGSIDTQHIADAQITHVKLANDSVDGDNIQDNVINSEHYAPVSIDTEHIANENITTAKLAPDAVTSAKLADNAVNSEHYVDGSIDHVHLANDIIDGDNIQNDVINSEHYVAGSIDHEHLANDIIDGTNIQDSVINSEHYVDGSIDSVHLAADIINGTKIANDSVDSEHIAAGALDNEHYAAGSITSDKLNGATVITASEQASATTNDTSFLTSAAADARFFNVSTGDTIKDGDTFPDNDTTIATTAAINDRIIDLVDDVGGFVPIANETSFPNANPDVNNGAGTIVSISTLASNHTSNGSGVITISNGTVGNSTVTINGAENSTTYSAGYGLLVETTSTLNTYTFHRLVPKATEVTTVAGKATEIGRLGTADAVADMAILGTTDVVADLNTLGTADVVADMNMLATSDVISDMNTLAVTDVINDMDTVATNVASVNTTAGSISNVNTTAGSITNVNTVAGSIANVNTTAGSISNVNSVAGSIANVNTTASNIGNVNNFASTYQIASSAPSTDGGGNALAAGDLYFDTTADELKVYTGSAWQGGVTATGNFAVVTGNTFTGSNIHNDNVKSIYGTGSDGLEIYHDGTQSIIADTGTGQLAIRGGNTVSISNPGGTQVMANFINGGACNLFYSGDSKLSTTDTGIDVTGNIVINGNVDGRDLSADGVKLDGIETAATADQTASEIVALVADQTIAPSTIDMEDNEKILLGTGDDLEIYHDSSTSHSYIDNKLNDLFIRNTSDDIIIQAEDDLFLRVQGGENALAATGNGEVELYHDGSKKLETASGGVTVTGVLNATSTVQGASVIAGIGSGGVALTVNDGYGNANVCFNHKSGTPEQNGNAGRIVVNTDSTSGANMLFQVKSNVTSGSAGGLTGVLALYETVIQPSVNVIPQTDSAIDLGSSSKRWAKGYFDALEVAGDVTITDDLFLQDNLYMGDTDAFIMGDSEDLIIKHDGTYNYILSDNGHPLIQESNEIQLRAVNNELYFKGVANGAVELYYDGVEKLSTNAHGVLVTGKLDITSEIGLFNGTTNANRYIDAGLGDGNELRIRGCSDGDTGHENMIVAIRNAGVELYYDANKKFETTSAGAQLSGHLQLVGNLDMDDNHYIKLGTGDDLQIYHDGSNSYIDCPSAGTGHLIIKADDFLVQGSNAENMIKGIENAGVELFHNNDSKFFTTADGATVTGVLIANHTNGSVELKASDGCIELRRDGGDPFIDFKDAAEDFDQRLTVNSSTGFLFSDNTSITGNLNLLDSGFVTAHIKSTNNDAVLQLTSNNDDAKDWTIRNDYSNSFDLDFRYNNSRKMDLDASGNLTIVGDLHLDNADRVIWGTSDSAYIEGDDGSTGYLKFGINDTKMTINGDGQVTIGANTTTSELCGITSNFGQDDSTNGMIGLVSYQNDHPADCANKVAQARSEVGGSDVRRAAIGTYRVGTNNPAGFVHIDKRNGGNCYIWSDSSTRLRVATGVGNIGANSGDIVGSQSSDIRLKNNLGSVSYGLAEINQLSPIKFTYKDDDTNKQEIGFSAQDVISIIPEAVYDTEASKEIDGATIENCLSMQYVSLIPVLVNAIKELSTKVAALEAA